MNGKTWSITGLVHTLHERQFDFIVYDNFMDILGKLLFSKKDNSSFFLNTNKADNWEDFFYMEKNRISISYCLEYYEKMMRFLKQKNPNVQIIFINFPLMHKHESAKKRVQEINEKYLQNEFLRKNTFFIPAGHIQPEYLMNDHHFQEHQGRNLYQDYASIVRVLMDKKYSHSQWNEFIKDKQNSLLDYAHQRFSLATSITV
ncbi:hypothetical protein I4641_07765 [Waterburya agarophytonicola K14]|uniref:Uncharacterized protein n=1 Tax=Waterburya agarophytonicola KI4 TaxID=2874699 RepID=A0A964BQT6_9CYAN|nr:hypothetical protein [Waterburya agarophytonicola]MCC0176873.1 hypothetical protein [Waterburya agarophytonicola KI4]